MVYRIIIVIAFLVVVLLGIVVKNLLDKAIGEDNADSNNSK